MPRFLKRETTTTKKKKRKRILPTSTNVVSLTPAEACITNNYEQRRLPASSTCNSKLSCNQNLDSASRLSHSSPECTTRTRHRDETTSTSHTNVRITNTRHPSMSTYQTQNELFKKKKTKTKTNQHNEVVTNSHPLGSASKCLRKQAQLTPNQAC